jgi:hypothetical protein
LHPRVNFYLRDFSGNYFLRHLRLFAAINSPPSAGRRRRRGRRKNAEDFQRKDATKGARLWLQTQPQRF